MNLQRIAQMSCNPAMGGVAKGQIVREIDALGGYSGLVSDNTMIQFRMLNKSKGPAVWSPRAQTDRVWYAKYAQEITSNTENLTIIEDSGIGIEVKSGKIKGVLTEKNGLIETDAAILTTGTFLNGIIFTGLLSHKSGRAGEEAAYGIIKDLKASGYVLA